MLAKKHSFIQGKWKYFLLVPILVAGTLLTANTAPKEEHVPLVHQKTFKGNTFLWRESDTLYYDRKKRKAELVPANAKEKQHVIVSINDEPVYQNDLLDIPATYGKADTVFVEYMIKQFQAMTKNTADSFTFIVDINLVVNKEGRPVYFEANYGRATKFAEQRRQWDPVYNPDVEPNKMIDKILSKCPSWKPAMLNGKPVTSFVNIQLPGC